MSDTLSSSDAHQGAAAKRRRAAGMSAGSSWRGGGCSLGARVSCGVFDAGNRARAIAAGSALSPLRSENVGSPLVIGTDIVASHANGASGVGALRRTPVHRVCATAAGTVSPAIAAAVAW